MKVMLSVDMQYSEKNTCGNRKNTFEKKVKMLMEIDRKHNWRIFLVL